MVGLENLSAPFGAKQSAKRVGRGIGSGHGKTSTRGHKGQKARNSVRPGFEGGQTPIQRRLRKRKGVSQSAMNIGIFRKEYAIVNVGQLDKFEANTVITPELLVKSRIVREIRDGLRVLGGGELTKPLTIQAKYFSTSAAEKITAAGGSMEVR
ncbi:MAG TPA: 50S ribosomal protein L15 [Armatimonadota bacterium]|nr:50S ribosomal protein L15 [Armatimonadota bacterium]